MSNLGARWEFFSGEFVFHVPSICEEGMTNHR